MYTEGIFRQTTFKYSEILVQVYLKASAPVGIKVQKLVVFLCASRSFQAEKLSVLYPSKNYYE